MSGNFEKLPIKEIRQKISRCHHASITFWSQNMTDVAVAPKPPANFQPNFMLHDDVQDDQIFQSDRFVFVGRDVHVERHRSPGCSRGQADPAATPDQQDFWAGNRRRLLISNITLVVLAIVVLGHGCQCFVFSVDSAGGFTSAKSFMVDQITAMIAFRTVRNR